MWDCIKCGTIIEDESVDTCWKCKKVRDNPRDQATHGAERADLPSEVKCLRCHSEMECVGVKNFHESSGMARFLGDLATFLVNREQFEIWACQTCGKVELYLTELGSEFRPIKS